MFTEMPKMLQEMLAHIISALPSIMTAIVIFIVFLFIAKSATSFVYRVAKMHPPQRQPIFYLLATISRISILLIGVITALGSAGVNVSALVASLGLSGLALSFASKDAFSNLLAGIMVLFYQPFKIGDIIEVGLLKGEVVKMSLRYTHLISEQKEILIPNSTLLTNNITIHKS